MSGVDWDEQLLGPVMAVFGDAVTYRPKAGQPYAIADAVFDSQYGLVEVNPETGASTTSRMPVLGVRDSAFQGTPKQSDMVDIPTAKPPAQYVVKTVQPDGHGHTLLVLNKRADL